MGAPADFSGFVESPHREGDNFPLHGGDLRFRPNLQPPFCIWAEENGSSFAADNKTVEHALTGTVDYFSKQEYDPAPDAIESTLSGLGLIWELNSVQYEDETELIHHEWTWSMR